MNFVERCDVVLPNKVYDIWIEAECLAEGQWNTCDGNTDVIVKFKDGSRWVASFFTYTNIKTLVEKNKKTGECMNGKYFWASDMILIDEVSRKQIEEVIDHLINEGEFEFIFKKCSDDII